MTIYRWLILAFWLIFIAYWIVAAAGAKRNLSKRAWGREAGLRLVFIALILVALRIPAFNHVWRYAGAHVARDPVAGIAGTTLCALGIAFAIWARVHLGRNWGMPMSRKERPELVTTGPYALVRHPIYSGLMLAMLGSAIAQSRFLLLPFAFVVLYFVYSARTEERVMEQEFPNEYAAYRARTKMLVPFIL